MGSSHLSPRTGNRTAKRLASLIPIGVLSLVLLWPGSSVRWTESLGDERQYDWLSFSILTRGEFQAPEGDRFPGSDNVHSYYYRAPGFPFFLAAIYRVLGDDLVLYAWGKRCQGRDCLPPLPLRRDVDRVTALLGAATATGVFGVTLALAGWLPALLALCACLAWFFHALDTPHETLAALLLFGHAACMWQTWRRPRLPTAVAGGLFLGLLVLTKAAFQYWLAGAAVALLAGCLLQPDHRRARACVALVLTACAVAVPWMTRNAVQAGHFTVSGRSGNILSIRAEYGTMSWPEIVGAYAAWAPSSRVVPGHVAVTDALRRLLEPEVGYVGFNRGEKKRGYYMRSQRHVGMVAYRAGTIDPLWTTSQTRREAALNRAALEMIRADWLKHVALTPAFLLRGTGAMNAGLLGLLAIPAFVVVLVGAWRGRDVALLLFLLPAVYAFVFHATATHFIPRYGLPAVPIAFVVCALAGSAVRTSFQNGC